MERSRRTGSVSALPPRADGGHAPKHSSRERFEQQAGRCRCTVGPPLRPCFRGGLTLTGLCADAGRQVLATAQSGPGRVWNHAETAPPSVCRRARTVAPPPHCEWSSPAGGDHRAPGGTLRTSGPRMRAYRRDSKCRRRATGPGILAPRLPQRRNQGESLMGTRTRCR